MSTDAIGQSGAFTALTTQIDNKTGAPEADKLNKSPRDLVPDKLSREPETSPAAAELQNALEEVQNKLAPVARDLHFSVHENLGKTVIEVIDTSTEEVIRQIPSEEMMAIAEALDKLQGLLIKQEV